MEFPKPTTVQGAFDYLILFILLFAAVCGLYILAAVSGIAPAV